MTYWTLLLTTFAVACAAAPAFGNQGVPTDVPDEGVSESLARERASRVSDLRYDVRFEIPSGRSAPIPGRVAITFTLADASRALAIDFDADRQGALGHVELNGRPVDATYINRHLVFPAARLQSGTNQIVVEFSAGDGPLNRNDDFLYTIFVPSRAHQAFPCFDQPDLKGRWTLTLEVPSAWEALANGAEASRDVRDGRTVIRFAETERISTYLFAFAAGRFSIERAERNGRALRMFHRETDAAKVARNRDAIFDLHARALEWLEDYTRIPYPFGKFDVLLVPAFQFGGMEHPGAIFYNANGVMLDESATENQKLDRASVIAHETSHMWFGDLVTMRWFDDVWMKEVFANFMAAKIVNPSFPHVNHELRFLLSNYPGAYEIDRTAGTNAIRQPLANLSEAGSLYGAIIYQKAPIVMRQLETMTGPGPFRDGVREYLDRHRFGNASWPDLIDVLAGRTPGNLKAWSHVWVNEPGRPIITTELKVAKGRITGLSLTSRDPLPGRGQTWPEELQVALGYDDGLKLLRVRLDGNRVDIREARGLPAPHFVLPNGGGIGYGEFHLDVRSRAWIVAHLPSVGDAVTRGSAWVTLWDAMLAGDVAPARLIDLALRALPRESDELNTQRILGYLNQAYWKFTPPTRRTALAPRVERTLRKGLDAATTTTLKAAYFAALRDLALTRPTTKWLESVWRQQTKIEGLTLSETDYIVLSEELAVRAVPGWKAILERQIERTENPDRKARLQFVAPALSPEGSDRDRLFASLHEVGNRRREPWALEALWYLNHPLRGQRSLKYVADGLRMLPEIQRTGDIFFPKRWVDNTLGGHRSPAAARIVREFIDRLPATYPDRLRRIVLSAADGLFRASRLR